MPSAIKHGASAAERQKSRTNFWASVMRQQQAIQTKDAKTAAAAQAPGSPLEKRDPYDATTFIPPEQKPAKPVKPGMFQKIKNHPYRTGAAVVALVAIAILIGGLAYVHYGPGFSTVGHKIAESALAKKAIVLAHHGATTAQKGWAQFAAFMNKKPNLSVGHLSMIGTVGIVLSAGWIFRGSIKSRIAEIFARHWEQ